MSRSRILGTLCSMLLLTIMSVALGQTPKVGQAAPEFRLPDQDGKLHSLEDYRGKWVALYFYPKDQTPGCTAQACEFRDNIFAFKEAGAAILGVSVDDVASHKQFAAKHGLPFPLLADAAKETAKKYGVLKSYLGTMELAKRDTFIIDPEGRIVKYYPDVDPKGHSKVVLADIKAFQARRKG